MWRRTIKPAIAPERAADDVEFAVLARGAGALLEQAASPVEQTRFLEQEGDTDARQCNSDPAAEESQARVGRQGVGAGQSVARGSGGGPAHRGLPGRRKQLGQEQRDTARAGIQVGAKRPVSDLRRPAVVPRKRLGAEPVAAILVPYGGHGEAAADLLRNRQEVWR